MKQQYGRIGLKIAIGYIVLIIIAVYTVGYVYSLVEDIALEEDINSVPRHKIYLVTNTLTLLYESETMGQLLDMHDEDYSHYNETLDKAQANMDTLRMLITDPSQHTKTRLINMMIEQKRRNTKELLDIWRQATTDLYAKNIERALSNAAPPVVETEIQEKISTQQDTVVVQAKRRSFLRRLADVFVPDKQVDTSIVVSANQEILKDSLHNVYDPNAAISRTLKDIQSTVQKEREQIRTLLLDRSTVLRYDNSIITTRINQLLRDIEEEELQASLIRIQSRQQLLESSSYLIGGIAMISFIFSVFFLIFIVRDLSKSKYYRKQLIKEKEYTEDLLHSREQLMRTISHDIRSPLSSIIGYIGLLQQTDTTEQQQTYLKNMNGSSHHILQLVNDLLDYESLQTGQMKLHEVPFRTSVFFQEVYDSFKPQAEAKGLAFKLEIDDPANAVLMADTVRVRQITANLLSNAIKFTDKGSVLLKVYVNDAADIEGTDEEIIKSVIKISVHDTGPGISKEEESKVFGEFSRLDGSEKTEGFGLGLSITRRLAQLMGGSLHYWGEVGEGTIFEATIAVHPADDQSLAEETKEETVDSLSISKPITCLLVDDDPIQLVLMEEILKQKQIKVISSGNPNEVIDILRKSRIDVVFTDINMPQMDGNTLLKLIRSSDLPMASDIPVVVLSASVDKDIAEYQDKGFTDAINKPYTAGQVFSVLNRLFPEEKQENITVDVSPLTAFAEGDKEASNAILQTFVAETNKSLDNLRKSLAANDRDTAASICHKLIPTFTLLGAETLVQQLRILNRNDKELTDSGWKSLLTEVISQATLILNQVEAFLQ